MEYEKIIGLIQEMTKTGLTRIKIEEDDFKLVLEKNIYNNVQPSHTNLPSIPVLNDNKQVDDGVTYEPMMSQVMENSTRSKDVTMGTKKILSPMVGTFYAQPSPEKPSFVKIGDVVKQGQSVCIIEAMKLMNEIESEVEGEILECLVENEDMVEFGQPLFIVK